MTPAFDTAPRRRIGITVGKFNPPHQGHAHLVRVAASRVDDLYVILGDRHDQTIAAEQRAEWLLDASPSNVSVIITPDDLPEANEPWAARSLEILPEPPTIAFTSEGWGPGWADAMGIEHESVDTDRSRYPISARRIRHDLRDEFDWLVPAAKAALARRVVIAGAESTGKTTLAQCLARRLETSWAPEHGRWYWEGRRHLAGSSWDTDEFRRIAAAQHHLMDDLARRCHRGVLIADTDALVTAVWHRRFLGFDDPGLETFVARHRPDAYLITSPDIPWVQDGTRESAAHRQSMHDEIDRRCRESGADTHILSGSIEERAARALAIIEQLTQFEQLR